MSFVVTPHPDGAVISLKVRKFLREHVTPFDKWEDSPATRYLRRLVSAGHAKPSDIGLMVGTEELIDLPESLARVLGLPSLSSISLGITLKSRIESPDGELSKEWRDNNYRSLKPEHQSIFVGLSGRWERLSPALFRLSRAIDAYNATKGKHGDDRIPLWVGVQAALEAATGEAVRAENLVKSFRIFQAGAFGLDVKESVSGPQFDPVLMSRAQRPSLEDVAAAPDGGESEPSTSHESDEALLVPDLQRAFAKTFSNHGGATRASYVVAPNTYVTIAPELQRALDVVRNAASAGAQQRRDFIRNPRSFLVEALEDLGEEAGCLFVETESYSDRVLGLGLWEKPSLPWLQRGGSGWLPERVTLNVGDKSLEVDRDDLPALRDKVETARASAEPHVAWEAASYPTNEIGQALDALDLQKPHGEEAAAIEGVVDSQPVPKDKNVLLIAGNLDELQYLKKARQSISIAASTHFPNFAFPKTRPKPHQEEGFRWLAESWMAGRPGVLLADDMGLGKTLQALAFLAWLKSFERVKSPVLIVAPTALLRNWQSEVERHLEAGILGHCVEVFGKSLKVLKKSTKGHDWTPEDALDTSELKAADWILTTYETLANYHRAFARVAYSVVIFDEMQKIKAPDTINAHAAKTLNAGFVLGLTGTPIENRIEDLWSIMDRVHSGFFDSLKSFSSAYGHEDPQALKALKAKLDHSVSGTPPILLRRMKEDHLPGLPQRTFCTYRVEMPPPQAEAYKKAVAQGTAARGRKVEMLRVIHALRGISLHPFTAEEHVDVYDHLKRGAWLNQSARTSHTIEILRGIKSRNEKAIVFIEDRGVQKLFSSAVAQELGLQSEPSIINGSVPGDQRLEIVEPFQKGSPGFDLLVLSPKAAGIGLTITAANHVIHLSRWWNPAVEDQCNDRVFRIGQEKPVTVHIPQAIHPEYGDASFDVKLDMLLARKRALSRDMLAPPISDSDVTDLFDATVV